MLGLIFWAMLPFLLIFSVFFFAFTSVGNKKHGAKINSRRAFMYLFRLFAHQWHHFGAAEDTVNAAFAKPLSAV
jgi:hypothetical protein